MAENPEAPPAEQQQAESAPATTKTALSGRSELNAGGQEAPVAVITQAYSNYVQELQGAVEGLRQRALSLQQNGPQQLQQLQSQLQPQTEELVQAVTETQAPVSAGTGSVVNIFGWSAVLLTAATLGSIVGGYLLSPLIGVFLGRFGAGILATVAIPAAAYYYLRANEQQSDAELRFALLSTAGVQGVLLGHALAYTYLSAQPIAALSPLVIAFAYPFVAGQVGGARLPLLGGVLGASFATHFVLGLLFGQLTASYFLLALLYTASAGVVLQLAFKNVQSNTVQVHAYQLALVSAVLLSKGLVFGLFGSSQAQQSASN